MKNLYTDPRENAPIKHTITPDELKLIHQQQIKSAQQQQAYSDLNFLRAIKLGEELKKSKE